MNISIRCPDNMYQFGLVTLLGEIFSLEMAQQKLRIERYHPNNMTTADIMILKLSPGEHYLCHAEFYTRLPRLIVGLIEREHIPARGEIPTCIRKIVFIPQDTSVSQMGEMIKQHWLSVKKAGLSSEGRSCLHCPQKTFTAQQRQLIFLLLSGFTSKQIGIHMHICHKTVLAHRRALMNKFRLRTDCELLQFLAAAQDKRAYSMGMHQGVSR
ncbi:hypothetical protein C3433_17580 [Citrobacter freundii]|nr:hypothetical protein C3433_17580 [Citrobacter freundii]